MKRRSHHLGTLDDEELHGAFAAGPGNAKDLFSWCEHALKTLVQDDPRQSRKNLHRFLFQGVDLITHYSGKGTAESIFKQLETALRNDLVSSGLLAAQKLDGLDNEQFRCISACDKLEVCQNMLKAVGAEHVFSDLESRMKHMCKMKLQTLLPSAQDMKTLSKEQLEKKYAEYRDELFAVRNEAFTSKNHAWCAKHGCFCPIWGNGFQTDGKDRRVVINAAGFTCVDFSPRKGTTALQLGGKSASTFWTWLTEVLVVEPTLVFYENSPRFSGEVFEKVPEVWELYSHYDVLVSPNLLGWPVSRLRRFGVLVHRQKATFHGSGDAFLQLFRRQCLLTGDIFWSLTPKDYVLEELRRKAASRGHHLTGPVEAQRFKLEYLVTPAMLDRQKAYEKQRPLKQGLGAEFIVDLDQSPAYSSSGPYVPSVPKHCALFSFNENRLMVGREILSAMGHRVALVPFGF